MNGHSPREHRPGRPQVSSWRALARGAEANAASVSPCDEDPGRSTGHGDWVWLVTFSSDDLCLTLASRGRTAKIWDAMTGHN